MRDYRKPGKHVRNFYKGITFSFEASKLCSIHNGTSGQQALIVIFRCSDLFVGAFFLHLREWCNTFEYIFSKHATDFDLRFGFKFNKPACRGGISTGCYTRAISTVTVSDIYFEGLFLSFMDGKRIRILLVDDHRIVLDGLVSLLENDLGFTVVGALTSGKEALEFLKKNQPDILLTDYNLPGVSGLELTKFVRKNYPSMKVVALSMHDEAHIIKNILKEGVDGYLLKNIRQFELKNALKQVMMGQPYVSPEITKLMMQGLVTDEPGLLTEREKEIVRLITKEFSNKQIAERLFISERTVETHRKNIFRKTKTSTVVGLVKFAIENKLV